MSKGYKTKELTEGLETEELEIGGIIFPFPVAYIEDSSINLYWRDYACVFNIDVVSGKRIFRFLADGDEKPKWSRKESKLKEDIEKFGLKIQERELDKRKCIWCRRPAYYYFRTPFNITRPPSTHERKIISCKLHDDLISKDLRSYSISYLQEVLDD